MENIANSRGENLDDIVVPATVPVHEDPQKNRNPFIISDMMEYVDDEERGVHDDKKNPPITYH